MSKATSVVLFDAGHTLIEPHNDALEEASLAASLSVPGSSIGKAFRRAISGLNGQEAPSPTAFRDFVAAELGELGLRDEAAEQEFWRVLDEYNSAHRLWTQAIAGTAEALEILKKERVRMGVISNSDGHVEHYLERAGLIEFFEVVVDSHLVGVEKPDERIFAYALDRMKLSPAGILFVGDRIDVDVIGARGAGLRGILFEPGGPARSGVDVIGRLDEVLRFL
jgi:putative hydrolase of the HAD superfamily